MTKKEFNCLKKKAVNKTLTQKDMMLSDLSVDEVIALSSFITKLKQNEY